MKNKYNKFFALSVTLSTTTIAYNLVGGVNGLYLGLLASAGILTTDRFILDDKLSNLRVDTILNSKKSKNL